MFSGLSISEIGIILAAIVISLAAHEAVHAYVSHWLGDSTAEDLGRLTLNPLKHIDLFTTVLLPILLIVSGFPPFFIAKPVPFNPERVRHGEYGAALIGVAGPLTNLALAAVGGLAFRLWGLGASDGVYHGLLLFSEVNVAFFVFNMIPVPPLDGSRLLYAFAPEPLQRVMFAIEQMGFFTILIFMLVLFPVISPVVDNIIQSILQFLLG